MRTLAATYPDDLDIYRLLASVYRQTGNLAEAGRWGFLTDEVRPAELEAFARVHANPWSRLRLLRWNGDPSTLSDDGARDRLAVLVDEAEASGPPEIWAGGYRAPAKNRGSVIPCLFTVVALTIAVALAGIGAWRALSWILQ